MEIGSPDDVICWLVGSTQFTIANERNIEFKEEMFRRTLNLNVCRIVLRYSLLFRLSEILRLKKRSFDEH